MGWCLLLLRHSFFGMIRLIILVSEVIFLELIFQAEVLGWKTTIEYGFQIYKREI